MRRIAVLLLAAATPFVAIAGEIIEIQPPATPKDPFTQKDKAVYRFLPDSQRDPESPALYAFSLTAGTGAHDFRSFLHFDLPPSVAGACIDLAEFYVYYGFEFSGFGSGENVPGVATCEPVLEPWDEVTLTWNNQPSRGASVDVVENVTSFGYLAFDVTTVVQSWIDGTAPNHGLAISSPTGRVMGFYSFEATEQIAAFRPALFVTLADDPAACPEPAGAVAILAALGALALCVRART
jgi:hypothetical protein